jgi:hypothetical protein
MTIKKSGAGSRASIKNTTEDRERIWLNVSKAADAIRKLIRSTKMNAEEKIAVGDGINNLAKEVESMLDRIDMASSAADQRKLLTAYKKFLEYNIEVVNRRLEGI